MHMVFLGARYTLYSAEQLKSLFPGRSGAPRFGVKGPDGLRVSCDRALLDSPVCWKSVVIHNFQKDLRSL